MPPAPRDDEELQPPIPGEPFARQIAENEARIDREVESDEEQAFVDEAAKAAAQEIMAARAQGRAPQLQQLKDLAPAGSSPAEVEAFVKRATRQGQELAVEKVTQERQAAGEDADVAAEAAEAEVGDGSIIGDLAQGTPTWILEQYGVLDDNQKSRIVEYWNDLYGTNFTSFESVIPLIEKAPTTPQSPVLQVVESALLDAEPTPAFQVKLPVSVGRTGRAVTLTPGDMAVLQDAYGMSADAITRSVRLASVAANNLDPTGEPQWQPIVALLAATGRLDEMAQAEQIEQTDRRTAQVRGEARERMGPIAAAGGPGADLVASAGAGRPAQTRGAAGPLGRRSGTARSVTDLVQSYNEGLQQYNHDETLAFLHSLDPALANRIAMSGGDPLKVNGADNAKAVTLLQRGGIIAKGSTPFEQLGGRGNSHILGQLQNYFDTTDGARAEGEEPKRQLPDPVAVRQTLSDLWRAIMRQEPSESIQRAFEAELNTILSTAPDEQSIDVQARIKQFVQGQPLYRELYGHKPAGMSEADWQGQYQAAVQSILGNEHDENSILAAMRGGDYQTAVGSAAASKAAATNSTWLGRLARAGQVIGNET